MKRFKAFLVSFIGAAMLAAFTAPASAGGNLLDGMSAADWRALNVFFSNFCEAGLADFDAAKYDDAALIAFGMQHNVINNRKALKSDDAEKMFYIERGRVDAAIEKYFGIKGVKPRSVEDRAVIYKKGRYYWDDILEGAPGFAGGQAVELYDAGGGALSAVVEFYMDTEAFQNDVMKLDAKDFYAPRKTWKGNTVKYYSPRGYYSARIAPHAYGGKKTWKLLEWHEAETLKEARKFIGK
jgi:hypothetical protein